MNPTSIAYVRSVCGELGLRPSRRLGQNFLVDGNIRDIILAAACISASDTVFEAGPGLGAMTFALIEKAGKVIAVEKDARLFAYMRDSAGRNPKLLLVHGDILDTNFDSTGANRVVSNLPYSSASRFLINLTAAETPPECAVVTIQKEVAVRITAEPGSGDYGILALWLGLVFAAERIKTVRPTCFWPKPDVNSEIVRLRRREGPLPDPVTAGVFRGLTKKAFSLRRKKMSSIFRCTGESSALSGGTADFFAIAGISGDERPENISRDQWWALARLTAGAKTD